LGRQFFPEFKLPGSNTIQNLLNHHSGGSTLFYGFKWHYLPLRYFQCWFDPAVELHLVLDDSFSHMTQDVLWFVLIVMHAVIPGEDLI
jgi:hypothetical protein